jgi:predicted NAD/FAD-dependent oxidoreductase
MLIRKGDLEGASRRVEDAAILTVKQEQQVEEVRAILADAQYREIYDRAYSFEQDHDYQRAIFAYRNLLAVAGFYEDAQARLETLEELVSRAESLWARAEAAVSPEERLGYLLQIAQFWPEFETVLEELDAAGIEP